MFVRRCCFISPPPPPLPPPPLEVMLQCERACRLFCLFVSLTHRRSCLVPLPHLASARARDVLTHIQTNTLARWYVTLQRLSSRAVAGTAQTSSLSAVSPRLSLCLISVTCLRRGHLEPFPAVFWTSFFCLAHVLTATKAASSPKAQWTGRPRRVVGDRRGFCSDDGSDPRCPPNVHTFAFVPRLTETLRH